MAALITIDDIEGALGRPAEDAEEEAQWQYYIDTISFLINDYVDVSFEVVEDEVRRFKANYEGEIELPGPVIDVTAVNNFRDGSADVYVDWDGMTTLFYLESEQVVDVTWSYGYTDVPDDIKSLVLTMTLNEINELSPTDLRSFKVGDVMEEYRDSQVAQLFGQMGLNVLNKYVNHTFTIDASGSGSYPDYLGQGFLEV